MTSDNPTPTLAKEINTILDTLPDYLPDECATLNHNDLPEIKSALLKRFEAVMLETLDSIEKWVAHNKHDMGEIGDFIRTKYVYNKLDDERQRLTAVLSGEEEQHGDSK